MGVALSDNARDYREALDYLFARTTGKSKLGLERTAALLHGARRSTKQCHAPDRPEWRSWVGYGSRGGRHEIQKQLFDAGLHIKTTGDAAVIAPALIAESGHIDELCDKLRLVLKEY